MTQKELRNFLTAADALCDRLPDNMIVALLKLHAGFGKREIEQHVSVEQLLKTGWAEYHNNRLRLSESAKTRLGLTGKKKNGSDPRVEEIIRIYRDTIKEARNFDPTALHNWGGLAKAAKGMLTEASIHPKLKDWPPDEQLRGIERIIRAMAYTEDKYDCRSFLAQRWHLWAFTKLFFKYIEQMLEVQQKERVRNEKFVSPGKGRL